MKLAISSMVSGRELEGRLRNEGDIEGMEVGAVLRHRTPEALEADRSGRALTATAAQLGGGDVQGELAGGSD